MSDKSDAELVTLARQGDKVSFGVLVERYHDKAERVALSMVSSPGVANELIQEAFLAAYLSLDNLRKPEHFAGWLGGIVRNMCRNYLRASKASLSSLEALPPGLPYQPVASSQAPLDPQAAVEAEELSSAVLTAIEQLSDENRIAVRLFYYRGQSARQIADSLDISVQAVKGRLHKSRKLLREKLAHFQEGRHLVRRTNMIQVSVADVVRREDDQRVVVLVDQAGQRALPIWVGAFEMRVPLSRRAQVCRAAPSHARFHTAAACRV